MNGDFNNIDNFGCKFVNGATNGPGTYSTNNQWYTMSMGLGSNYNFGQFVCQIAIPRNTQYPTLSVRFKESGSWGSWTGLTAYNLNMRTNIWHDSDENLF